MFLFILLASLGAFIIPSAVAAPSRLVVAHPIHSQLPLIARVGAQYSWTISSSTFTIKDDQDHDNSAMTIAYTASGLPPWLSFSSSSLSFTGTVPSSALSGTIPITVTASINTPVASVSDTFELLVSNSPPPRLAIPLSQQFNDHNPAVSGAFIVNPSSALAPYYSASTPKEHTSDLGLRVLPATEFSIGIQGGTFAPWPLSFTASLVSGERLPSWISFDPDTYTFDGTAPGYESGSPPEPIEVLVRASDAQGHSAGPTARQSFWLSVATHELKLKDGSMGIIRNVSVGAGFVLPLMDGPNDNPWVGEVFWDAGFVPRSSIKSISVNISDGTAFAYDVASQVLSGSISASTIGEKLPGMPISITDTQNITLHTQLLLNPVPSFFVLPSSNPTSTNTGLQRPVLGELMVPQNFSSPIAFDLTAYMIPNGPDLVKNGAIQLSAVIEPNAARSWLSFDGENLVLKGIIPARDGFLTGSSTSRRSLSSMPITRTVLQEKHKHRHGHQSLTNQEQVYAALPTAEDNGPRSSTAVSTSPSSTLLASAAPDVVTVNVTFSAHSLESRTISTFHLVLLLGANTTCSTTSCSLPTTSSDDASSNAQAAHVGLILGLVFGSLLLTAFVVACYYMRRTRSEAAEEDKYSLQRGISSDEKAPDNAGWGGNSAAFDGSELERGVGTRRAQIHSMAETRSVAATMVTGGSSSGSGTRAATPTVYGAGTIERPSNAHEALEELSVTSGSRYEDGTSIGTSSGVRAHAKSGSESGNGSGTDREPFTSESEVDARRLAPPAKTYIHPTPAPTRANSPVPSSITMTSGATIPKQTFFAKLKNLGPPHPRDDPSSESSSGEERIPPKVPSKPSNLTNIAPTKASISTSIVTAIKQSSLGSLFGMTKADAGSVNSKASNRSGGMQSGKSSSGKKLDIGKPRMMQPSLGAYLAKDYAEQVARAASSEGIVSRQPSDDGGSGFVAGNVVIYSMDNRPLPVTRLATPTHDGNIPQPVFPTFVWPNRMTAQVVATTQGVYPITPTSQRSVATVVQAQANSTSHPDVPTLLRNRSNEADIPQATSHDDAFSSSSEGSTLGRDGSGENLVLGSTGPREIPHRRFDFGRPRGSVTDSDAPATSFSGVGAASPLEHARVGSQESLASVAVVGTAALAVRSPLTGVKLVPSPKPSISSDTELATRHNSPKAPSWSSPSSVHSAPTVKARLVQFVHEKQYDGGSSSEGASTDYPVPGAYSAYQGKREISHKAVIEGYETSLSEKWANLPPAPPVVQAHATESSSRLADKVKMLREQSRIYHEQQIREGTASPPVSSTRRTPSPTDDGLLNDPALALGLQYLQSFGSNGSLRSEEGKPAPSRTRISSPDATMGIAVGGEDNTSAGSVAGKSKVTNGGSIVIRSRQRVSELQASFIAYDNETQSSSETERRTPPRIPLPAPPATETQYFDLSESSSGEASSSSGSVIAHRAGQERVLVGVNEPFNFPSPLILPGFSPGQASRARILRLVKAAHQLRKQQQESDVSKSSDSDGVDLNCKLWAVLESGSRLPEWLGFDPLEAEFWGVPVAGRRGSSLRVKVLFREGQNVTEVGGFILEVVGR